MWPLLQELLSMFLFVQQWMYMISALSYKEKGCPNQHVLLIVHLALMNKQANIFSNPSNFSLTHKRNFFPRIHNAWSCRSFSDPSIVWLLGKNSFYDHSRKKVPLSQLIFVCEVLRAHFTPPSPQKVEWFWAQLIQCVRGKFLNIFSPLKIFSFEDSKARVTSSFFESTAYVC